jgi:hypothetical protein
MSTATLGGIFDTMMSDTVGVVYRASTGKVDPWTTSEINNLAAQDAVSASGGTLDYATALAQAQNSTGAILANQNISWWSAFNTAFNVDDGSGCTFTNIKGCLPNVDLSWAPYILGGVVILGILWVLRPYVGLVEE